VYYLVFKGEKHVPMQPAGYLLSEPAPAVDAEVGIQKRPL